MKNIKKCFILILIVLTIGCNLTTKPLKQDYYTYINKDTIDSYVLKDDEYTISTFTKLQDKVNSDIDSVLTDLITTNKDINIIYNQIIDTNTRNTSGLSDLKYYIDLIDSSTTINEYIKNAMVVERDLYIPIFTSASIMRNLKDTTENMLYFQSIPFAFNSTSKYYTDDDYLSVKTLIKQYDIKLLKEYGYDKTRAREVSKNITDYYTKIANKSHPTSYYQNKENLYNPINKSELQAIYTNLDSTYFDNIPDNVKISLLDKENYSAINDSLTDENLPTLKEIVKLKILENYGEFLSENYAKILSDFSSEQLGIETKTDINDAAKNTVIALFQNEFDISYTNKYLTKESKEYILSMTNDIINYYEKSLTNLDWLSQDTKNKAITKLKNITINIGLNENDYYNLNYNLASNNTLIKNILKIKKVLEEHELERLKNNVPATTAVSQTTINAYYNPQDNSINFPSAVTNLVDLSKDYYENLGSIGMIIAHEITHAFDSNGAKFDEHGNLVEWWNKEDKENYQQLQKQIISYYDKYEVIAGNYINGSLTVDENIADLGAVNCISNLAKSKNASTTNLKAMYKSFANLWVEKSNDEYQKILLLVDTHSPAKYRVNATLSSTDIFYEVYNVSKTNPMYISKDKRVHIW